MLTRGHVWIYCSAARPLEAYLGEGLPNAAKASQEAYAQLEALGKTLLEPAAVRLYSHFPATSAHLLVTFC